MVTMIDELNGPVQIKKHFHLIITRRDMEEKEFVRKKARQAGSKREREVLVAERQKAIAEDKLFYGLGS